MSNLILNLRVGYWHLQIERGRWWMPRICSNRDYWRGKILRPFVERYR